MLKKGRYSWTREASGRCHIIWKVRCLREASGATSYEPASEASYAALSQQGYQQDLHFCLQQDRYAILPQYQAGQIQSHQQLNTIAAEKTHA